MNERGLISEGTTGRHDRTSEAGGAVRLSEVLGALSFALDLTEGQPYGHSARTCLIGMRLADALELPADVRSDLYYALILKDAGCSTNAHATAELFGVDDHAVKQAMKTVDWSRSLRAIRFGLTTAGRGRSPLDRFRQVLHMITNGTGSTQRLMRLRCERGADIVRQLGFPGRAAEAVRTLDEHWDGHGEPEGLAGDRIPLLGRLLGLAQTVEIFAATEGWEGALKMARRRSGSWFDPELVRVLERACGREDWWAELYGLDVLPEVARAEPADRTVRVDDEGIDRVAAAFADVVDAKTPFTYRHSTRVAEIARSLARKLDLGGAVPRDLYRAGLLHDIGKLGISNRILDKDGPLTDEERLRVERHPVLSWTILGQVETFAPIARLASVHHEKLDGGGYPWGFTADRLGRAERILAVADVYEALTADRPYREALSHEKAFGILTGMMGTGLDPEAVQAMEEEPSGTAGVTRS